MKRLFSVLLVVALGMALLAGCAPKEETPAAPTPSALPGAGKKVLLLVSGTLGDKSFFDSANAGM